MIKFLSLLLSVTLLFSSLAPSYAQASSAVSAQKARIKSQVSLGVDNAVRAQVRNGKFAVKDKAAEVRAVVKALTSGSDVEGVKGLSREEFDKVYEAGMKEALATSLGEAKTDEERAWVKATWDEMMSEEGKSAAYREYQAEATGSSQEAEKEAKKYLKQLGREIIAVYKGNRGVGIELIREGLPVFASIGAIDSQVKAEGAAALRKDINEHKGVCGGVGLISGIKARFGYDEDVKTQTKACEDILASAAALSVLGQDGSRGLNADTEALGGLLASGYNGIMGPAVIMTVSQGLLAMNGERALTAELIEISRKLPDIGLLGNDLSFLSVGDWVKAATVLKGDYAIGLEYSFYKGSNGKGNLNNAWVDLGMYLAQYGGKGGKYVLDRVVGDSVWYGTNGLPGVKFKPFVTGALAGGYRIEKGGEVYERLGKDGRGYRVDTRKEYAQAKAAMAKAGLNESGYFAASLYYSGKDDLDPYTRVYINNLLAAGYKKTGNKTVLKGMGQRTRPTQAEIAGYASAQKAIKAGRVVDIVLVVVFTTKLAASAVKLGVQGIKNGVRVLRLARAGNAVNGLGIGKNLSRVIRIGRLQKYGVASAKEVARMRLAAVTGARQTKLVGGVKKVRAANIQKMVKAREAAKAKGAAQAASGSKGASGVKMEVRGIDGEGYLIPEGMEVVRVQGRPVYVEKGLSRGEIAKRFNVSEGMVQEAGAGSWGIKPAEVRYATAGEGAAVRGKVQPVMEGPKQVVVEGGVKGPSELAVRYEQVPVKNALGNEVLAWRAVEPVNSGKKVGFLQGLKDRAVWYWTGTEDFARGIGSAARSRLGSSALAMSMNFSSAPVQAVKGETALLAKGFQTEHMLKLKDIVWFSQEARGGLSGASHAVRGANQGAISSAAGGLVRNAPVAPVAKTVSMVPNTMGALSLGNAAVDLKQSRAFASQNMNVKDHWWNRLFRRNQVKLAPMRNSQLVNSRQPVGEIDDSDLDDSALHGFKMTYVDENGEENLLPVNVTVDKSLKADAFNHIAFTVDNIAQLRGEGKEPKTMAHFFMKLRAGQLPRLVAQASRAGVQLKIKLESAPNIAHKTVTVPLYNASGKRLLPVEVHLPAGLLAETDKLVLDRKGHLSVLRLGVGTPRPLSNFYVRIPKYEIPSLVKLLKNSKETFNISILPTQDKASLIVRDVSLTNVSLGKTMAPIAKKQLGMSVADANTLMFMINYVLPGFASLIHPVLKKYGEKKLLTISLVMSALAGLLAVGAGFYGFVEKGDVSGWERTLFVSGLVLMSAASILKQLVCNMLISANRGEVVVSSPKDKMPTAAELKAAAEVDLKYLKQRIKEFFTEKSDVSLKDVFLYNLSFVYKNAGTLAFLASPYLFNWIGSQVFGVDLGLDYSISFPIYAAYSMWVTARIMRANIRDAYSAKNLEQSQQALVAHIEKTAKALEEAAALPEGSAEFNDAAEEISRKLKEAVDALVQAQVKLDNKLKSKAVFAQVKAQTLKDLETALTASGALDAAQVKDIMAQVNADFNKLENSSANVWKVFAKAKGVKSLAVAMTLASVHEFILSSSFAASMNSLIPNGSYANFLVALSLYLPFIVGRLGGNIIGKRISSGSMYILCSALSAIGTGIMIFNVGNLTPTIIGAVVASLGVGNFFTQMYDYIMQKHPKLQREISVILALTMAIAGLATLPAAYMTSIMDNLDLIYAGACLGLSLVLTPGMMKDSSLAKFIKYEVNKLFGKKDKKDSKSKKNKKDDKGEGPSAGASPSSQEPLAQVPVKNKKGEILAQLSVPLQQNNFQLKPRQEVFILPNGEMILRKYRSVQDKDNKTNTYKQVVIRDDLKLYRSEGKLKASALNLKKIGEGLLLANSKIWPMFLMYVLLGMNNVATIVSNFAEGPFQMSKFEMFLLGNVGSFAIGLLSLPIGILQSKFSRRAMSNIGMLAMIGAFLIPYLAGLDGTLGDPTALKKWSLAASFLLLGVGGAFLDVSLKPTLLAASKKGNYQRNVGALAVFKQVFGNSMNYLLPPVFLFVAGADWTAFFPVYMAISAVGFFLYNKFRLKEQTLQSVQQAKHKYQVNLKSIWEIFSGKNPRSRLVRKSFLANVLHGANMGTLALFVNSLMKEHFADPSTLWQLPFGLSLGSESWVLPSFVLFTFPIIFGRMAGTFLGQGVQTGPYRMKPVNPGKLLQGSGWLTLAGLVLINMPWWQVQAAGVVLCALGLTNFAPILTAFPSDKTREISNEMSALLSFSSFFSALFTVSFGLLWDVLGPWSQAAFLLLTGFLGYIIHFGKQISRGEFDKLKERSPSAEEMEAYEEPLAE